LTHQDCLQSWLQIQRGGGPSSTTTQGRCELCKTPFRFAPVFADDAPDRLPALQVAVGVLHCAAVKWLPFLLRAAFALSLWLMVAPLLTAYLYHGWMNRPMAIWERMDSTLVAGDMVSGAVVAAVVIVSFLSLMNFADFLRVEINNNQRGAFAAGAVGANANDQVGNNLNNNNQRRRNRNQGPEEPPIDPQDDEIDNDLFARQQQRDSEALDARVHQAYEEHQQDVAAAGGRDQHVFRALDRELHGGNGTNDDGNDDSDDEEYVHAEDERDNEEEEDDDDDVSADGWELDDDEDEAHHRGGAIPPLQPFELELERQILNAELPGNRNNNNAGNRGPRAQQPQQQRAVQAIRLNEQQLGGGNGGLGGGGGPGGVGDFQDDPIDMDINIALDELLGIRGPLDGVVRNLMWLLAFNTAYLGFFAFTPRVVGMAVTSILFNSTSLFASYDGAAGDGDVNATASTADTSNGTVARPVVFGNSSLLDIFHAVEAESERQNTTFRLSVLFSVVVGYLACACVVLVLKSVWTLSRKVYFFRRLRAAVGAGAGNQPLHARDAPDEMRDLVDRLMMLADGDEAVLGIPNDLNRLGGEDDHGAAVAFAIAVALDVMTAIVKVAILLLLKMFLLPIALGLCLDASTLSFFGSTLEERVLYAGRDLFSFTLLHWVVGITFMLLVTVSVLQLREVAHPDLLAQVIRPQEPHPDLLGNLMHETLSTHTKRMVLSLVIYAALMTVHVYLPIRLLMAGEIAQWLPFFQVKLSYLIMPEAQVPLELLFFHICMLGVLEKNKNSIGEMQHHWLKYFCGCLGITESALPRTVEGFRLIGSRRIFLDDKAEVIDPFWQELAKSANSREDLIRMNISTFENEQGFVDECAGETKANGERVVDLGSEYVRLPVRAKVPGRALRSRSVLLPTKIGRYRLKRSNSTAPVFEVWEEVPGNPIPRPPEGWDDLGAGGADVQGRWAWGRELKSNLERGIAVRDAFYRKDDSSLRKFAVSCKLLALLLLSWATTTASLFLLIIGPLAIGRFCYYILRFQDAWIHDPFAFAIGSMFFFPLGRKLLKSIISNERSVVTRLALWISRFRLPPTRKLMYVIGAAALWFAVAPLLLGSIVDVGLIKSTDWFMGKEDWIDAKTIFLDWVTGFALLYVGEYMCIAGVMTKSFWDFMFPLDGGGDVPMQGQEGAAGNNNNNDDMAVENHNDARDVPEVPVVGANGDVQHHASELEMWQGPNGRIARFYETKLAVLQWEWDKVDPSVLIYEVPLPITIALLLTLVVPLAAMVIVLFLFRSPVVASSGLWRASFVRGIMVVAAMAQAASAWREQVLSWFEAAHRTARNDRYLIGEVLMDYAGDS